MPSGSSPRMASTSDGDVVLGHVAEPVAELLDRAHVEDRGQRQPQHLSSSHGAEDLRRIVGLLVPAEHRAGLLLQRRQRPGPQLGDVFEPGDRFRERSSSAAAKREPDRTRVSRSAASEESRRSRRYQWVVPSVSLSRRNESSPKSGSVPSANHEMSTGMRCRWMAARRLTPAVSAAMCASAPRGSWNPIAASRASACSLVSSSSEAGRAATADSSGR